MIDPLDPYPMDPWPEYMVVRNEIGTIDLVFTGNPVELRQWVIRDDSGGETTVILGELDKNARLPHTDFSIIRAIESLN